MSTLLKLRSAPSLLSHHDFRIDRANLILRDVVAMQSNVEVIGYDVQTDLKTLSMMMRLGNTRKQGVRQRFGHPGISENAMGKKLGLARNFRVDGDVLRHDTHFFSPAKISPAFGGMDPVEYLFQMAEQYPEELAESVVMEAEAVWILPDGREVPQFLESREQRDQEHAEGIERGDKQRPVTATTRLPVVRPVKFWYVDYVNEGAATPNGVFSADAAASLFAGTSGEYAQEVFGLIDRFREEYGISLEEMPEKVNQVLSRYLFLRGTKEENMPPRNKKMQLDSGEAAPEQVLDVTTPEHPQSVEASQAEPAADTELDAVLARAEARVEEQEAEEQAPEQELSMPEMQAVLAEQRAQIATLNAQVEKLTKLALLHDENIARLDRNVRRIDGDAVLTMSVPRGMPAGAKLEAMASSKGISLSTPVPSDATRKSAEQALQQGIHARHGTNGKSDAPSRASRHDDEARASFAASQYRAKHDGGLSNS